MTRIAIYPGSFDPPTKGHEDIIRRGIQLCDRLIVAVAHHSSKNPLFSVAERLELLREIVGSEPTVDYVEITGLVAHQAREAGATVLLRGLRVAGDFEYERQMAVMNRELCPGLETVFLAPAVDQMHISSTLVREVARYGGDVSRLVHPLVAKKLSQKFA